MALICADFDPPPLLSIFLLIFAVNPYVNTYFTDAQYCSLYCYGSDFWQVTVPVPTFDKFRSPLRI